MENIKDIFENFDEFAEEVKAIIVEREYRSHMELIEAYYEIGKMLLDKGVDGRSDFIEALAQKTGRGERNFWNALAMVKKFPTIEQVQELPEGKTISWNKITGKYLSSGSEVQEGVVECKHEPVVICGKCRKTLSGYRIIKS